MPQQTYPRVFQRVTLVFDTFNDVFLFFFRGFLFYIDCGFVVGNIVGNILIHVFDYGAHVLIYLIEVITTYYKEKKIDYSGDSLYRSFCEHIIVVDSSIIGCDFTKTLT